MQKVANQSDETGIDIRSDRCAKAFVWSVWFVMMLVAFVCLAKYGRNIPLTEDWLLVPPLTGNEPDLGNWLWAQNNEHRIPLPRLIMLILLKITQGDFRVGMLFNIVSLGILAVFMIRTARQVRGGRTRFLDAIFPVILLHLGNWENLFWNWQLGFVVPTVLTCSVIIAIINNGNPAKYSASVIGGTCLVLLPLCGANGLLLVPFIAIWFGYSGMLHWYAFKNNSERQWACGFLLGSAMVALCLLGLYFVGYDRPSWTPPPPGFDESIKAGIQFLSLGFGPFARSLRKISMIGGIGLLLSGVLVALIGAIRHEGQERHRAMGILVLFTAFIVFAIAIGWGRAGVVSTSGYWPIRYVFLSMPAFCTAYFAWELYGPTKIRAVLQVGLFLAMCLLIPFNTIHGFWWRDWYLKGTDAVEKDLMAGTPRSILAERHRNFLFHSIAPSKLEDLMQMLYDGGIGSFARMQVNPVEAKESNSKATSTQAQPLVTQEIRYQMPDAGEVFLIWGIDGWNTVIEEIRPAGTKIINKIMHTPMAQDGDYFVAKVQVPFNVMIEYGFLITKERGGAEIIKPIWDGQKDYQKIVSENGGIEVKTTLTLGHDHVSVIIVDAPLVTQEIRYHMPDAGEVFFVWGIDGWKALAKEIRPVGTKIKNKVMQTPMARDADTFVAKVQVPISATLVYGFLITDKRGIFDIIMPVWDGNKDYQGGVSENGIIEVKSTLTLPNELSDILDNGHYFLVGMSVFLITWLLIFIFLGFFVDKKHTRDGS